MAQNSVIASIEKGVKDGQYPAFVYKFRSARDCNTVSILTNNTLWFENPNKFNDPYDCNVPIDDEPSQDVVRQYFKNIGATDSKINSWLNNPDELQKVIKNQVKAALSNLGVCCFSKVDNDIVQWSHYADNHNGVCFKFDLLELCKSLGNIFIPLSVKYQMELPRYNHCTESNKIAEKIIKPKFCGWNYESEVRIVKQGIVDKDDNEVTQKLKRAVTFNPIALKEIIFGVKASDDTIKLYKEFCKQHNKNHVEFSKMELGNGTYYELVKQKI